MVCSAGMRIRGSLFGIEVVDGVNRNGLIRRKLFDRKDRVWGRYRKFSSHHEGLLNYLSWKYGCMQGSEFL